LSCLGPHSHSQEYLHCSTRRLTVRGYIADVDWQSKVACLYCVLEFGGKLVSCVSRETTQQLVVFCSLVMQLTKYDVTS